MDLYNILLYVVHVFSAFLWFGFAMFQLFILVPAAQQSGNEAGVLGPIFTKTPVDMVMMVTSILTLLSGLLLFYEVSNQFNADYMGGTNGIILSIGVLAGIGAALHGGATLGPLTAKLKRLLSSEAPEPSQLATLRDKIVLHGRISGGMMVIALFTMASHPWWGS